MVRDHASPSPWPDHAYHPHYPSIDHDYAQRLHDRAGLMGNPFRLAFRRYSAAEELAVAEYWRARLITTKGRPLHG